MERLTDPFCGNLDPWECCGQDEYCQRGCHDEGGCRNGCIVPKLYRRLAAYEDTGLTPEEVEALKADNDRLHKLFDEIEEVVIAKPKDPSDKKRVHCKDCDYLNMDDGKPYCCHSRMSTNGLDDWCDHAKRKENNNAKLV